MLASPMMFVKCVFLESIYHVINVLLSFPLEDIVLESIVRNCKLYFLLVSQSQACYVDMPFFLHFILNSYV